MTNKIVIEKSLPGNTPLHKRILNTQALLWLALILALAGSLKHLAAVFASVDGNHLMGWVQAAAVDAGLFALAYGIKQRKVAKRSVKPLWLGVILFSGISIYGNLAYGLLATTDNLPLWIMASRPYVLAASLPVLVLYLAELLSDDRQHAVKLAEREAKRAARQMTNADKKTFVPGDMSALGQANEAKQDKVTQRRDKVLPLLQNGLTDQDIAQQLDVSTRTIARDRLALNGRAVTS